MRRSSSSAPPTARSSGFGSPAGSRAASGRLGDGGRRTMTIGERAVGDVTVVDVSGRITIQEGADQFRDVTRELIRQGRVKIVLNLQDVPYIDSTALGEIIRTYTSVIRKGGSVKLLNTSPHVHQL